MFFIEWIVPRNRKYPWRTGAMLILSNLESTIILRNTELAVVMVAARDASLEACAAKFNNSSVK